MKIYTSVETKKNISLWWLLLVPFIGLIVVCAEYQLNYSSNGYVRFVDKLHDMPAQEKPLEFYPDYRP